MSTSKLKEPAPIDTTVAGDGGDGLDRAGFPQSPSAFDSDPRISFSKLDQKFILETEDGEEFEYDSGLKRWIPAVCSRVVRSGVGNVGAQVADGIVLLLGR